MPVISDIAWVILENKFSKIVGISTSSGWGLRSSFGLG